MHTSNMCMCLEDDVIATEKSGSLLLPYQLLVAGRVWAENSPLSTVQAYVQLTNAQALNLPSFWLRHLRFLVNIL